VIVVNTLSKKINNKRYFIKNNTKLSKNSYTLSTVLAENNGPLKEPLIIQIFTDIFSAIEFLHKENIVHQQLCPENIILSKSKSGITIAAIRLQNLTHSLDIQFNIHDNNTHSFATNYYESPEVFWAHINPMNQNIEEISKGKSNFFHPPLESEYFSSQSGNHGLRNTIIDFGVNTKKWCQEQNTLFLLNPSPANDMWAAGVILAQCLTGISPPLLTYETALNHDLSNQYSNVFNTLTRQLLSLEKEHRYSASEALQNILDIKSLIHKQAS
jgi:serine/threonine protein kinase